MKTFPEFPSYPPLFLVRFFDKLRNFFLRLNRKFTHPNVVIWEMVHNVWLAAGISVAVELGIPDLLKEGPHSVDELAERTGTHRESLYRVMRMLASQGIFKELEGRRFAATRLSGPLEEGQIRYLILLHLTAGHFRMFGELIKSVRSGKTVSGKMSGSALFDHIAGEEQRNERFNRAMSAASWMQASVILSAFSFKRFERIVDIGGGEGLFLASILRTTPGCHGLVFDLPSVIKGTDNIIRDYSLKERMEAEGGDFFKKVPEGGDLYLLKNVLHDWDDEACRKILGNIHAAMDPGNRLLIIDSVIREGNDPSIGKMTDILMMAAAGGKERTVEEFRLLLEETGFRIRKIHPTISHQSLIEAKKI